MQPEPEITMTALRTQLAAAALLAALSTVAIATEAQAAQSHGRDKISAMDRIQRATAPIEQDLVAVPGRLGRLPIGDMATSEHDTQSRSIAEITSNPGRS
jgi:hypothetical protein